MKFVAIVLASGVVAGLAVYAFLEWQGWVGLMMNDVVTLRIHTLVGAIAAIGFGSAALALGFRRAFDRADRSAFIELESRIARLESERGRAPSAPTERAT